MRLSSNRVKHSAQPPQQRPFSLRWLEGWQLVVPSVGMASLAAWLALPQPTLPAYLPLPTLSPADLEQARGRLLEQAADAKRTSLPFEIRALGERFRQLGQAIHRGVALSVDERSRYRTQVKLQLDAVGKEPLLELRAIQTELFVIALSRYDRDGVVSEDLAELGGDFISLLEREDSTPRPLRLNADERRALFLMRWTDLAGLSDTEGFRLEPTWQLLSANYRLKRPLAEADSRSLATIDRISTIAADYPTDVARGLVFVQLGQYASAIEHFQRFLAEHPNAPYSIRAQNHLLYASVRLPRPLPDPHE